VSLWRGWEDIISHLPFPELTLSFSFSCPAIEGDDPRSSRGHLSIPNLSAVQLWQAEWILYELIGLFSSLKKPFL